MKRIIIIILMIFLLAGCGNKVDESEAFTVDEDLKISDMEAIINEYYIFGTHLNIIGELNMADDLVYDNIKLVIFHDKDIEYDLITERHDNKLYFKISDLKNTGIYLDNFEVGQYIFLLKVTINDEALYYKLKNNTNYDNIKYTTITKENTNKKLFFSSDNSYGSFGFTVNETISTDYDIVIDAGHGGKDCGASYNGNSETDFTLTLAKKLKQKFDSYGLKVKLTRDDNTLTDDDLLPTYGPGGRVTTVNESRAKYAFSFHLNSGYSNDLNGIEVYTANNIDYTLARSIAANVVAEAGTNYSDNNSYKQENGVYTRTFKQSEIDSFAKELKDKGLNPYSINYNNVYYYFIRETGGYINGAYIDGREGDNIINNYYNSNVGRESYIMEIGYITYDKDVENVRNNSDKYIDAIYQAIINNIYN